MLVSGYNSDGFTEHDEGLHNLLERKLLDYQYRNLERQHSKGVMSIDKHAVLQFLMQLLEHLKYYLLLWLIEVFLPDDAPLVVDAHSEASSSHMHRSPELFPACLRGGELCHIACIPIKQ